MNINNLNSNFKRYYFLLIEFHNLRQVYIILYIILYLKILFFSPNIRKIKTKKD